MGSGRGNVRRHNRACFVALSPPLFLLLLVLQVRAASAVPSSPFPGVTIVDGQTAPSLQGQSMAHLYVFAFSADTLAPISFQVDERDRRDRWVIDRGPHPTSDDTPGFFDTNDVIVFMNRDLGRRGDPRQFLPGASLWAEVRVGDEQHPIGFVYIGVFAIPPLLQAMSEAARYEAENDRVYAERYALAFGAPLPTHLAFVTQIGDFGTNIIAGVHAIGEVRFLGGVFSIRRSEHDIQMEVLGHRTGPVRVIRRARYMIPLPFGFRSQGRFDLLFYRDFVEGTTVVNLKIPPRLILADGELRTYFDFLQFPDARPFIEGGSLEDRGKGDLQTPKPTSDGRPTRWAALALPDGKVVLFVVRLEGALQRLEQRFYFDNPTDGRPTVGGQPRFGFLFSHINRVTAGTHRLSVFAMVLENATVPDIELAVRTFLSPPAVQAAVFERKG